MMVHFRFTFLGHHNIWPTAKTRQSAGYDLVAAQDIAVIPGVVTPIKTGIKVDYLTEDYYIRIAARSSLAMKHGMQILAGVIDADYRGEIVVLCTTLFAFQIKAGEAIAQMIIERRYEAAELPTRQMQRIGGFGSTNNS